MLSSTFLQNLWVTHELIQNWLFLQIPLNFNTGWRLFKWVQEFGGTFFSSLNDTGCCSFDDRDPFSCLLYLEEMCYFLHSTGSRCIHIGGSGWRKLICCKSTLNCENHNTNLSFQFIFHIPKCVWKMCMEEHTLHWLLFSPFTHIESPVGGCCHGRCYLTPLGATVDPRTLQYVDSWSQDLTRQPFDHQFTAHSTN